MGGGGGGGGLISQKPTHKCDTLLCVISACVCVRARARCPLAYGRHQDSCGDQVAAAATIRASYDALLITHGRGSVLCDRAAERMAELAGEGAPLQATTTTT
jgi:hypothetical protein